VRQLCVPPGGGDGWREDEELGENSGTDNGNNVVAPGNNSQGGNNGGAGNNAANNGGTFNNSAGNDGDDNGADGEGDAEEEDAGGCAVPAGRPASGSAALGLLLLGLAALRRRR
jgi:MYXO-CTERM domain-containing protein